MTNIATDKKWIYNLIFFICTLCLLILCENQTAYGDVVIPASEFGDMNLYNYAIKNFDTNGNGQLEQSEAEAVTKIFLSIESKNISEMSSLKGLEYFVNLEDLTFSGGYVVTLTDISVLGKLTNMNRLVIKGVSGVSDYSALSGLVNLEILDLYGAKIQDVSFLSNMTKLRSLVLGDIYIQNYEGIANLVELKELRLDHCGLTDISFLNGLTKLNCVYLNSNYITDFSPLLSSKESLSILYLGQEDGFFEENYSLETLEFLGQMTNLIQLGLAQTGLQDIPDLTGLTNLQAIYLHHNYLTRDVVEEKLPVSITSQDNWENEIGLNDQSKEEPTKPVEKLTINSNVPANVEADFPVPTTVDIKYVNDDGVDIIVNSLDFPDVEYVEALLYDIYIYDTTSGSSDAMPVEGSMKCELGGYTASTVIEEEYRYFYVNMNNYVMEIGGEYVDGLFNIELNFSGKVIVLVSDKNDLIKNISDIRGRVDLTMEGQFEKDVYVKVEQILNLDRYQDAVHKLYMMFDKISYIELYDISVYDKQTQIKVQPIGEVKVSLEIDEEKKGDYHVLRLIEGDQWTEVECYVEEGELFFYSDHFSIFSIVITELAEEFMNEKETRDSKGKKEDEKKFDIMGEVIVLAIVVITVVTYDVARRVILRRNKHIM